MSQRMVLSRLLPLTSCDLNNVFSLSKGGPSFTASFNLWSPLENPYSCQLCELYDFILPLHLENSESNLKKKSIYYKDLKIKLHASPVILMIFVLLRISSFLILSLRVTPSIGKININIGLSITFFFLDFLALVFGTEFLARLKQTEFLFKKILLCVCYYFS